MEQSQEKREQKKKQNSEGNNLIWDCGSTLYDSFEFNAFNRQLNSAIVHSRTMSMPHLVHCAPPPPPPSKLSRSIEKLLKSTFKFRPICSCSSPTLTLEGFVRLRLLTRGLLNFKQLLNYKLSCLTY
ncbi:hypothetical protein E1A91_D11G025400v1 [Gossypium mustelinum]|uniref:Uncharacterized protein n=1 Tax=Gossypium mustelinum TaxID=34275 RepID=A0A5D2SMJ4_GOSMU|nr:hypothetical protein E1A91_D11G025400v1 [Gossypium mustelinum]